MALRMATLEIRRYFFLLLVFWAAFLASPASAWKPLTHVTLAETAIRDALNDGKVTLYATDYESGTLRMEATGGNIPIFTPVKIGEYSVDPEMLAAIRANLDIYRAGVLGPDAYPDILTGQQIIHPAGSVTPGESDLDINHGGPGTDPWLQRLWNLAYGDAGDARDKTPQAKAFVAGFLTHAAGDIYAHTLVNNYTGGPFHFVENGAKHVVMEGYIAKRTRTPSSWNVSISGVEDFIYRNMVDARPGTVLEAQLLRGENSQFSIPFIYSKMRAELQAEISRYYEDKAEYDRRIDDWIRRSDAKWREGKDCSTFDFSCSRTALWIEAGVLRARALAVLTEKGVYMAMNGPIVTYKEHWVQDIDAGLRAWPGVSHELAKAMVFHPNGMDRSRASSIMSTYARDHLLSMSGAPDFVGGTLAVIGGVINAVENALGLPLLSEAIEQIKKDALNYLLTKALGLSLNDIEKYFKNPETYFNPVLNNPAFNTEGTGKLIDLQTFNREVLHLNDPGYTNPAERFDYRKFPAAYNTVTLTKLLLMSRSEVNRLMSDLGATARLSEGNAILGFITSLDDSNEWLTNPKLVAARDCRAYQKIFMRQQGENVQACIVPGFKISSPIQDIIAGQRVHLKVEPDTSVEWSVSSSVAGIPTGYVGDPNSIERSQIQQEITSYFETLRAYDDRYQATIGDCKLIEDEGCGDASPQDPNTQCGQMDPACEESAAVADGFLTAKAALMKANGGRIERLQNRLREIDNTYQAPDEIPAEQTITLHARALDGSDQVATTSFTLKPSQVSPALTLGETEGVRGAVVRVPIRATGLSGIASAQLEIAYDPSVLEPVQLNGIPYAEFSRGATGQLNTSMSGNLVSLSVAELTLQNDGSVDLFFRIKPEARAGQTPLTFDTARLFNFDGIEISPRAYRAINGGVIVGGVASTPPVALFTVGDVKGLPSEVVRVPIRAMSMTRLGSVELQVKYDPAVLQPMMQEGRPWIDLGGTGSSQAELLQSVEGFYGLRIETDGVKEGTLADLLFRVRQGAPFGRTSIEAEATRVSDPGGTLLSPDQFVTRPGSVEVGSPGPEPRLRFTLGDIEAMPGGTATVPIRVSGLNQGELEAAKLTLTYDPSLLSPVMDDTAVARLAEGVSGERGLQRSGNSLVLDLRRLSFSGGDLASVTFNVAAGASGILPVGLVAEGVRTRQPLEPQMTAPDEYGSRGGAVVIRPSSNSGTMPALIIDSAEAVPGGALLLRVRATEAAKDLPALAMHITVTSSNPNAPPFEFLPSIAQPGSFFSEASVSASAAEPGSLVLGIAGKTSGNGPAEVVRLPVRIPNETPVGTVFTLRLAASTVEGEQSRILPTAGGTLTITAPEPAVLKGDLNKDGRVNVLDATLLLRILVGLVKPSPYQLDAGDLTPNPGMGGRPVGDGKLTITDAIAVLRVAAGLG